MHRVFDLLKTGMYRLLYGSAIRFAGLPRLRWGSQIKVKSGTAMIGKHLHLNRGAYIAVLDHGDTVIGDDVSFNRNCMVICHKSIQIGDGCIFGPNVLIYDHDHRFDSDGVKPGYRMADVVIENGCWIGAGVTILRGTHIGEKSVIGAGCVVSGEIPAHSLVTMDRTLNITPIQKLPIK